MGEFIPRSRTFHASGHIDLSFNTSIQENIMLRILIGGTAASLVIAFGLFVSSCSEDDEAIINPPQTESIIGTVDSYSRGQIATPSGLGMEIIPGVIPEMQNNTAAKVTFSIESPVEAPVAIQTQASLKGSISRMGPEAFTFRWPVRINLPFPDNVSADDLSVLHYDASRSKWEIVPASWADGAKRTISTDALELGYYALAVVTHTSKGSANPQAEGGFRYDGESGYYYSLTVRTVTFKYPNQAAWYNLPGRVAGASGSNPTGGPLSPTYARLPQGSYEIWITRTKPGTLTTLPKVETYTMPVTGNIDGPLRYWGLGNTEGWTTLNSPGGGSWVEGRPQDWPQPTNPMGTGEFQATLTWINTSNHYADLDLHLYGPNNMHIYWLSEVSSDGSLQLDRDWQEEVGNAVENIFSVKQMPKGNYSIKLHGFSVGTMSMAFTLRVIRFGSVKTWTGALKDGETIEMTTFTVN